MSTSGMTQAIMATPFPFSRTPDFNSTNILSYSAFHTPSTPVSPTPGPTNRGRKRNDKENFLPTQPPMKRPRIDLTDLEKIRMFYGFIKEELGWTYGETLYKTSVPLADHNKTHKAAVHPLKKRSELRYHATDNQIMSTVQHFMGGKGEYTPGSIISSWYHHPYGRHERESELMFSTTTPYKNIGPVRPALSSFAAQTVIKKLLEEAERAIRTDSGLHVILSTKKTDRQIEWTDIGACTLQQTQTVIQKYQPLTWNLFMKLAARPPCQRDGVKVARTKRPPELIATGVISTLNFSRSSRAKLLPLATALLYFGSQVSCEIFRFQSRMGILPSYPTVLRAMRALSEHEAAVTLAHGRDPNNMGIIRLDNVQNYLLQRDPAIGRENKMNIGIAATYYEVDCSGLDLSIFDLSQQQNALSKDVRGSLTVEKFQNLLDHAHIERVCILQWIGVLVQHIPVLAHLRPELSLAYLTRVSKVKLEPKPTQIHPLASSGRNETILTEFKSALEDFFEQTGQTRDSFKPLIFPVGGDGLTYEKMIQLREYLQLHSNSVESMQVMKPMLEWWHTEWTNLSRIFEAHWGVPLSNDPSTLGHSAAKIGRKKPANLKKVDFYTSTDLAYLVLDARMLDCWRLYFKKEDIFMFFEELAKREELPGFEDLEAAAKKLYRSYNSLRGQEKVMEGYGLTRTSIPSGSAWIPASASTDTQNTKKKKKDMSQTMEPFTGDQILGKSIAFMRDTMHAREFTLATAQGDPGRIWEVVKFMLFTFAGSSHSKYTQYLLEMITDLEFECSPELRVALLRITLVNLRGIEGRWSAGDFIQEYFNRLLEAVVQRKGVEYGDVFLRDTWSRNIHHVGRLKLDWLEGAGLTARSATHTGTGKKAEINILLQVYKDAELHSFRRGRTMDSEIFVDDFQRGIVKLRGGKLQRWVKKTTRSRSLTDIDSNSLDHNDFAMDDHDNGDESESDTEADEVRLRTGVTRQPLRFTSFIDGELVVRGLDDSDDGLVRSLAEIGTQDDTSESECEDDGMDGEIIDTVPH